MGELEEKKENKVNKKRVSFAKKFTKENSVKRESFAKKFTKEMKEKFNKRKSMEKDLENVILNNNIIIPRQSSNDSMINNIEMIDNIEQDTEFTKEQIPSHSMSPRLVPHSV